jgi:glycosyltransferase involved in cell wall biosynthesis
LTTVRPRLLWANLACLLDSSSGAASTAREILRQLHNLGWDVRILGATLFDDAAGTAGLDGQWPAIRARLGSVVTLVDGGLDHRLLVTASSDRDAMAHGEENKWFAHYFKILDEFSPDIVFYYGGHPFDLLIADEARRRGIKVVFLLVNGNYRDARWSRDVDLIVTDSAATAALYRDRLNLAVTPVGKFIEPARVVAQAHERQRVLFVNPVPEKGALLVLAVAIWLQRHRPEITLEIVEGRGRWSDVLARAALPGGGAIPPLHNVIVTPHTTDMRPVYARARVLLAPSLWWESGARVLCEAMLNAIPAIVTETGGSPEMVGHGALLLRLAARFHEPPYLALPDEAETAQLGRLICTLFDDPAIYQRLVDGAREAGRRIGSPSSNAERLTRAILEIPG